MKKNILGSAIVLALGVTVLPATSVQAAVLSFDAGAKVCVLGGTAPDSCLYGVTDTTGSYFGMDADASGSLADSEKTVISQLNGVIVDGVTVQGATGSHSGSVNGTESADIDNPWEFFGNTGMHQTTSAIGVTSNDGAGNVELDFSGWSVTWNGIADIPMGGDSANFASDTGLAVMTCAVDCADGDAYTLSYASHVPLGDASGFGGVGYALYLTGTIAGPLPAPVSAVPVPAAVWLFGSGLVGLAGVARRRKSA